jgi:integrase/recombinase XerD
MRLRESIDAYIELKRANGVSYGSGEGTLRSFYDRVGDVSLSAIRPYQVLKFLNGPRTQNSTWRAKYFLLKGFFLYCIARNRIPALPMPSLRPTIPRKFVPYIYSRFELHRLLSTVKRTQSTKCIIEAKTFRVLILFLYATGALVGEALRLRRQDVDLKRKRITIYNCRFDRHREIPIGHDLTEILRMYCKFKHRERNATDCNFFLNRDEKPLNVTTLNKNFQRLRRVAGITRDGGTRSQPRLHDLRHTFAVHRLTAWLKNEADFNRMIPALSVYIGQVELASAGRYLTLTPERFRTQLEMLSPKRGRRKWRNDTALMQFVDSL